MFGDRAPSFALSELVGSRVDEARGKCEADGFQVEVLDLDRPGAVTLERRSDRIRLRVRRGKVEEARVG
ncbi:MULTISPECIES: hypothetical protein [Amycolatopsis]|uniref:hypothetical protein n=1 Tax=Amycolatopsis TaxID=1813 RepID=UPI001C5A38ED|nr:hypothetical protein [Amycolatopsis sp. TNS106]QXV58414.1 hypothetical protein CVV72_16460 [Amycolatopsis sp. TNS106]